MELIKVINARSVINAHRNDNVKFSTAYKFASFLKKTETQNTFYEEHLRELIDKYAKKDEKGNLVHQENGDILLDAENVSDWNKAAEELALTDVDAPDIQFTAEDFDGLKVNTTDIAYLEEFLKIE